jgi:hypothetical protein
MKEILDLRFGIWDLSDLGFGFGISDLKAHLI